MKKVTQKILKRIKRRKMAHSHKKKVEESKTNRAPRQ